MDKWRWDYLGQNYNGLNLDPIEYIFFIVTVSSYMCVSTSMCQAICVYHTINFFGEGTFLTNEKTIST
jgi:MinD superfamily P-loop ATPase